MNETHSENSWISRAVAIVSAVLLSFASAGSSLAADVGGQDIVAKRIGGFPVLHCRISYKQEEMEAHLLFDTSLDVPLVIHEKSVGSLGLHPMTATGQKVDLEFAGGIQWKQLTIRAERVLLLETLTKHYAKDLGEVPVVGIIGPLAIKSNVIELDLRWQLLRTMGMASDEARALEIPYEVKPYGMLFKGIGPTGEAVQTVLSTKTSDLILDSSILKSARKAGKRPNVLRVCDVAFGELTAFRFEDIEEEWPAPVNAVIGAEALRNCVVTIWPKRNKIAFLAQPAPAFPKAEQDYFFALADNDPEGVSKFIETKPRRRLLDEACIALFEIRVNDPKSTLSTIKRSLEGVAENYHSERRSAALLRVADALEEGNHPKREELTLYTLQLAIRESGVALEASAVHDVHLRLGQLALEKGNLKEARRHLLSAAFGMPKNGQCNYWLGELYRLSNKPRRAWSRYFQAILDKRLEEDDLIRIKALERLDELNSDSEFRKIFNMVTAEEYMAGRLVDSEFHAKTRYRFIKNRFPWHVGLVEFFVNSSDGITGGMELAFQALNEFFEDQVVMIAYHLNDPMHSQAARDRLAYYKKEYSPLAVFDGKPVLDSAIIRNQPLAVVAAENYPPFKDAGLSTTHSEKKVWALDGAMTLNDEAIELSLSIEGDDQTAGLKLHVFLCERIVMATEANGVFFHHFVARDVLTPRDGTDLKSALEKPIKLSVGLQELMNNIVENQPILIGVQSRRAPYVDVNMLMAAAFIQRDSDGSVLVAKYFTLPQKQGEL